MDILNIPDVTDLKIGTKFDELKKPVTTIQFTTSAPPDTIAGLVALYSQQPIAVAIQSPQLTMLNHEETEAGQQ